MRPRAQPLEADDGLLRRGGGVDDVRAANRVLEFAAAGDPNFGEVARPREELLRGTRLHAGAEDCEHTRVRLREKTSGQCRCRGGPHRGDVRPVHQGDRRSRRRIEERDRRLVRRAVAVLGKERDELAPEPARRRMGEHRAEDPALLCPGADPRYEGCLAGGELGVRRREPIEERVEVEQLLHFTAAQDKHRSSDGTPNRAV